MHDLRRIYDVIGCCGILREVEMEAGVSFTLIEKLP